MAKIFAYGEQLCSTATRVSMLSSCLTNLLVSK